MVHAVDRTSWRWGLTHQDWCLFSSTRAGNMTKILHERVSKNNRFFTFRCYGQTYIARALRSVSRVRPDNLETNPGGQEPKTINDPTDLGLFPPRPPFFLVVASIFSRTCTPACPCRAPGTFPAWCAYGTTPNPHAIRPPHSIRVRPLFSAPVVWGGDRAPRAIPADCARPCG